MLVGSLPVPVSIREGLVSPDTLLVQHSAVACVRVTAQCRLSAGSRVVFSSVLPPSFFFFFFSALAFQDSNLRNHPANNRDHRLYDTYL